MPYRLLALDLDDTLLREDLTISERTRRTLIRAQEDGLTVVLASGRPTGAMERYARDLDLARFGGVLLGFNGAEVTDARTGERLFQQSLSAQDLHELYDLSRVHGLFLQTYRDQEIVTPENNPYTGIEARLTGMAIREVTDFKAYADRPAAKVILLGEPERLKELAPVLRVALGHRMNLAISKPFFLEVTAQGVEKGHSLEFLARRLGIDAAEVMAVGDSGNDLGMLGYAGLGVGMANATAEVKALADHVTGHHEEDGVAEAVERFILG